MQVTSNITLEEKACWEKLQFFIGNRRLYKKVKNEDLANSGKNALQLMNFLSLHKKMGAEINKGYKERNYIQHNVWTFLEFIRKLNQVHHKTNHKVHHMYEKLKICRYKYIYRYVYILSHANVCDGTAITTTANGQDIVPRTLPTL